MKLPKSLQDKKIHTVDKTHRAILDEDNKMLAYGAHRENAKGVLSKTIEWTWVKKSVSN